MSDTQLHTEKTIGLIGGVSWRSTALYYQRINTLVQAKRGGHHSASLLLRSLDFAPFLTLKTDTQRAQARTRLAEACHTLDNAGAGCLLLCSNTLHQFADTLYESFSGEVLHIADCSAEAIQEQGLTKVGLLGTRFTMQQRFYKDRLATYGLDVLTPARGASLDVHDIITKELTLGPPSEASQVRLKEIIDELAKSGAQGVILGCTELPLALQPGDTALPLFDTTALHAAAAVRYCFS